LAIVQRTGYQNSSRSHFQGTDIWSTANPSNSAGPGWLGQTRATGMSRTKAFIPLPLSTTKANEQVFINELKLLLFS
jgi:uncharacterized protein (DUF1501 family)